MDHRQVPVLFRRVIGVTGAILLMIMAIAGGALAAPDDVTVATLTLAKSTTPAGGKDFPISAVGYVTSFKTSLKSPRDVDGDSSGRFYVVGNRASMVQVFDATGTAIDMWGTKGHGQQDMFRPEDIAILENGQDITVIVADTGNNRIQAYDDKGNYIGTLGTLGTGNGQFNGPQGLVTDPAGNIYVADTNNHRIQVLDSSGAFLREWGSEGTGNGQFSYPAGVDIGPDGNLYVADSNNNRIQAFTADGTFLRKWGTPGAGPGQFNLPSHLFVAGDGTVFVSDTYNQRIQKFTTMGRFLTMWGQQGSGPGQFERPNGLFVNADGEVFVVDIDNARVESYQQVTAFLDDGEEEAFVLPRSLYEITEPAENGWALTGVACEGSAATNLPNGVSLMLENDVPVRCTFTNASDNPTGSVAVFKYHDLDMDGSYSAGDEPLEGWTFRVKDDQDVQVGSDALTDAAGMVEFDDLAAGDYLVCEDLNDGWFNTEPGDLGQPIAGAGQEVCQAVIVTAAGTSDVSFGNVAAASVAVSVVTVPPGGQGPFVFTSDVDGLNGSLADKEYLAASVWPGSYTATQTDTGSAYQLTDITCDDDNSSGDVATRTATFMTTPGETVMCTFTNTVEASEGSIEALVYEDVDWSEDFSDDDKPLSGWTVRLRDSADVQVGEDATTDASGLVHWDDVVVGDYQVCMVLPADWTNITPGDDGSPIVGSGQEVCAAVAVAAAEQSSVSFGNGYEVEPESFNLYLPMVTR